MKQSNQNLAIIGGGIAGLTTAIGLNNIGIQATVYEAAPVFKPLGAGLTLAVNAMRALDFLGLREQVCAVAQPMQNLLVLNSKGATLTKTSIKITEGKFQNHAIHRGALHQVLLDALPNDQIIYGKKLRELKITPSGKYLLQFEDGSMAEHEVVLSAEGIHSKARELVLPESKERYAGYTCWRGIAENPLIDRAASTETWGIKGRFGIVPLPVNLAYWFAVVNAPQKSDEMSKWTLNKLKAHFSGYHTAVSEVLSKTPMGQILWNDIVDLKPINRFAFGHLLLIGDAAHATTPNMGQGACMAIEDAAVLSHILRGEKDFATAFQRFEQKRITRCHQIVNQSWRMGKLAQNQNAFVGNIRNSISRLIPSSFTQKQLQKIYDFELS